MADMWHSRRPAAQLESGTSYARRQSNGNYNGAASGGHNSRQSTISPEKQKEYQHIRSQIVGIVKELRDHPKHMLLLSQILVGSIGATARNVESQYYGSCEEYERDEIKRVMSRMISVGDSIMTKNNVIVPKEDAANSHTRIEERLHSVASSSTPINKSEPKKRKPFQVPRKTGTTGSNTSSGGSGVSQSASSSGHSNGNHRDSEFARASQLEATGADELPDDTVVEIEDSEGLSEGQRSVLAAVLEGESVFFTGSAGTGKSHVLKICVDALKRSFHNRTSNWQYAEEALNVTAPTGVAACNIGGTTIHSFGGIGKGDGDTNSLLKKVKSSRQAKERWQQCRVLVIDEISMLDAELFDKLEAIARSIRNNDEPFGGIQLILCGDFFQLPPVGLSGKKGGHHVDPAHFCFESRSWKMCVQRSIVLDQIFRQKDQAFVNILNEIRKGRVSQEAEQQLRSAGKVVKQLRETNSDIKPTLLYALNRDVDRINEAELRKCQGEEKTFMAKDTGQQPFVDQLKRNCTAPETLKLRIGAQVILLQNLDVQRGLVNGTRGIVDQFCEEAETQSSVKYPRVKFLTHEGETYETLPRKSWTIERGGEQLAKREQVPLKLAYALSIHKSQGMTVDLMECSMEGIFDFGQAYVALSRATGIDRMLVRGFKKECVKAHPRVVDFYASLYANSTPSKHDSINGSRKLQEYLEARKHEKNVKSFKAPRSVSRKAPLNSSSEENSEEQTPSKKQKTDVNEAESMEDIFNSSSFGETL